MSKFSDKIKSGEVVKDADWNAFLVEAHKAAPSMTPAAFASYKTKAGRTSYELLAASIENLRNSKSTVLDLACGDGYLFQFLLPILGQSGTVIGVDMSDGELAVAKSNYAQNKSVKLQQASAQSIPLADKSVEAVVCHMAFMLMLPIEPVVLEIGRVLKPGGMFSAVIGNYRGKGGLFGEVQKITYEFVANRYPKILETRTGDPRVQSEDGIRELFSSRLGFQSEIEFSDFALLVNTNAQGVWNLMKDMYLVSMMSSPERAQLEGELKTFAESRLEGEGNLSFEVHMRMFTVKKA